MDNHLEGNDSKREVGHDFDFFSPFLLGSHTVFNYLALRQHQLHLGDLQIQQKQSRVSSNPHTLEWSMIAKGSFQFSLVTIVSNITYINPTIQWTGIPMHFFGQLFLAWLPQMLSPAQSPTNGLQIHFVMDV